MNNEQDIILNVPFHTQHWDCDQWKAMGFTDREEAVYWERSCCGALCLQMAMEYFTGRKFAIQDTIASGLHLGAYTHELGWHHIGLAQLATEYGLHALASKIPIDKLAQAIDANKISIISIPWAFEDNRTMKQKILWWKKYGGHMCVVVGYRKHDNKVEGFFIHHTSKRLEQNWVTRFIPIARFKKYYTGRGVVVYADS